MLDNTGILCNGPTTHNMNKIFFETELSSIAFKFTQGSEVGLLTKSVPDHFQSWPVLMPPFAIPS